MKITILDAYTTNPGDLSWDWLKKYGECEIFDRTDKEDIVKRAVDTDILITNKTVLTSDILSQLPKLKFIPLLSTGYNVVDGKWARKHGIPISNIPAYSTKAVAQLTFAFILEFCNQVGLHTQSVKDGDWLKCEHFCYQKAPLTELCGKTLGIIGYGSIGKEVAKIASAFSMNIIANTNHPPKENEYNILFTTKDELLEKSDFVTIHCPLTDKTEKMVNEDFLSKMKNTAFLINTSRGGVVDENALEKALKNHIIAGAGVDVLTNEPPKDDKISSCDNAFITPHIAWAPKETRQRLMKICEENIKAFLDGKPQNVVN